MEEQLFEHSPITPAARANDTSDIWAVRGGQYGREFSRSFRTATIEHIMYGRLDCASGERYSAPTLVSTPLPSPTTLTPTITRWGTFATSGSKRSGRGSATFWVIQSQYRSRHSPARRGRVP